MFDSVQTMLVGAAAVVDTVLLIALLERRNWRYVMLPMVVLVAGAWLLHVGRFSTILIVDAVGPWSGDLRWTAMMVTVAGALLIPSAMLHVVLRLVDSGLETGRSFDVRYGTIYLPLVALGPISGQLSPDTPAALIDQIGPFVIPYITWTAMVNLTAAAGFVWVRRQAEMPRARQFLAMLSVALIAMTALILFVIFVALGVWPQSADSWVLVAVMLPVLPVLLFAFFVIRYNFMQLVLERTLVYGAIVVGVILLHRVMLADMTEALRQRHGVDVGILQGVAVIALVMAYGPLRQRTAEALRYLMGSRVAGVRERTRRLAVEMSSIAGEPPGDLLEWFVKHAKAALDVDYVAGWLLDHSSKLTVRTDQSQRLDEASVLAVRDDLISAKLIGCGLRDAPTSRVAEALQRAAGSLFVMIDQRQMQGLILLGRGGRNRPLGEEETAAAILLVEQLAATLSVGLLQADRLAAERRAMQNEKLSTLGLLTSSIAHEIKNPLSSIRTITTVLAEDLGPESPHAEGLRLMLGEIDRLTENTVQLLQFAKPSPMAIGPIRIADVLEGTVRVMSHLAAQNNIDCQIDLDEDLPVIEADENALRETVFNLMVNSIEAAGEGGKIAIRCRQSGESIVIEFSDNGPGIAAEVQDTLFEPFVSTKPQGSGLGLYVVGRRVRELGGEIRCNTRADQGTTFTLTLPVV